MTTDSFMKGGFFPHPYRRERAWLIVAATAAKTMAGALEDYRPGGPSSRVPSVRSKLPPTNAHISVRRCWNRAREIRAVVSRLLGGLPGRDWGGVVPAVLDGAIACFR